MKTQRLTKLILGLALAILVIGNAKAQFTDWKPYPITTAPHESKDSTRGHVWGYTFGSAYAKLHSDSINGTGASPKTGATQYTGVPKGFDAFSLQRVYLGYDYFFNKTFSAHIVLAHEEFYDGGSTSATKDNVDNVGDRIMYIKYCNVEWDNIFKGSNLTVGAIVTPSFPFTEEPLWGYRSLERTIMDMRGIVSSNDVGVNLGGKLWRQVDASGMEKACIGYNAMVGNNTNATPDNTGLTAGDVSNYKRFYGNVFAKFMNDKIVIDLYSDYHTVTPGQNDLVYRGLIGYKAKNYNISVEYFDENLGNQAVYLTSSTATKVDTSSLARNGFSIEGALTLLRDKNTHDQKLGLVARYDMYNPDGNFNANYIYATKESNAAYNYSSSNAFTEQYMMFALDYQPIKQIHIMPNIWYDGFSNRTTGAKGLNSSDNDIVARITFYFLFNK